ncbi:MAG TPA: hypothetical protein VK973_13245 [Arenicellales bacterium]|nr:hypothetical protein [Arenicellales bacterium]
MSSAASIRSSYKPTARPQQRCECGRQIVRDGVIRSRAVKLDSATALCRCKRWVPIEALQGLPATDRGG